MVIAGLPAVTTGCAHVPYQGCELDDDLLQYGIPTSVAWAIPAIDSAVDQGPGAEVVGIDLCHSNDSWTWAITRTATLHDDAADGGLVLSLDAETGSVLNRVDVTLDPAELMAVEIRLKDAVELTGETYPDPRLLSLRLREEGGRPVWSAVTWDQPTTTRTTLTIDAGTGELLASEVG